MTDLARNTFVGWELGQVGKPYKNDEHRCDPNSPTHDCSGLDVASMRAGGQPDYPCLDTFEMTAWIRDNGRSVSIATARATKGMLLLEGGPDRSQSPGGHGHVATSLGDGRTVEAYDTADGIIIGHVDGRPWMDAGPMRGVDYSQPAGLNPGPTSPGEARDMGMTAAHSVPGAHVQTKGAWAGRKPFVGIITQPNLTTDVVGFNGAAVRVRGTAGVPFMGMSVYHLGHLNAPIEELEVEDGNTLGGLAGDGGYFSIDCTAHYL